MIKTEYMVVWNTEDCIDSIPKNNFEDAKEAALIILDEWAKDGLAILNKNDFSDEVREGWNQMIESCWVAVYKYNSKIKKYEPFWEPSDSDFERIGAFGWFPVATLKEMFSEENYKEFSDEDVSKD